MEPLVLFGIDVETDVGSFTPFYEGVQTGMPRLLRLFRDKGISATFFFTGDAAREHPAAARETAADNEVGCHSLYHETLGDELFPLPNVRAVLPEEVELRISRATEWVEQASGVRPMYFYRGRFEPYRPSARSGLEPGRMRILEIPNFADMLMTSADPPLERDRDHWPPFRTGDGSAIYRCVESFLRFAGDRGLKGRGCRFVRADELARTWDGMTG